MEQVNGAIVNCKQHGLLTAYTCGICGIVVSGFENFNYHKDVHKKKFKCLHCGKHFLRLDDFMNHRIAVYQNSKYKCLECGTVFDRGEQVSEHAAGHVAGKQRDKSECEICRQNFSTYEMFMHMHLKHLALPMRLKCGVCNQSFQSFQMRRLHYDMMHFTKQCKFCGAVFYNSSKYNRHTIQTEKKYFRCRKCYLMFCTRQFLPTHAKRSHHSESITYETRRCKTCKYCKESYDTINLLNFHIRSNHLNFVYKKSIRRRKKTGETASNCTRDIDDNVKSSGVQNEKKADTLKSSEKETDSPSDKCESEATNNKSVNPKSSATAIKRSRMIDRIGILRKRTLNNPAVGNERSKLARVEIEPVASISANLEDGCKLSAESTAVNRENVDDHKNSTKRSEGCAVSTAISDEHSVYSNKQKLTEEAPVDILRDIKISIANKLGIDCSKIKIIKKRDVEEIANVTHNKENDQINKLVEENKNNVGTKNSKNNEDGVVQANNLKIIDNIDGLVKNVELQIVEGLKIVKELDEFIKSPESSINDYDSVDVDAAIHVCNDNVDELGKELDEFVKNPESSNNEHDSVDVDAEIHVCNDDIDGRGKELEIVKELDGFVKNPEGSNVVDAETHVCIDNSDGLGEGLDACVQNPDCDSESKIVETIDLSGVNSDSDSEPDEILDDLEVYFACMENLDDDLLVDADVDEPETSIANENCEPVDEVASKTLELEEPAKTDTKEVAPSVPLITETDVLKANIAKENTDVIVIDDDTSMELSKVSALSETNKSITSTAAVNKRNRSTDKRLTELNKITNKSETSKVSNVKAVERNVNITMEKVQETTTLNEPKRETRKLNTVEAARNRVILGKVFKLAQVGGVDEMPREVLEFGPFETTTPLPTVEIESEIHNVAHELEKKEESQFDVIVIDDDNENANNDSNEQNTKCDAKEIDDTLVIDDDSDESKKRAKNLETIVIDDDTEPESKKIKIQHPSEINEQETESTKPIIPSDDLSNSTKTVTVKIPLLSRNFKKADTKPIKQENALRNRRKQILNPVRVSTQKIKTIRKITTTSPTAVITKFANKSNEEKTTSKTVTVITQIKETTKSTRVPKLLRPKLKTVPTRVFDKDCPKYVPKSEGKQNSLHQYNPLKEDAGKELKWKRMRKTN